MHRNSARRDVIWRYILRGVLKYTVKQGSRDGKNDNIKSKLPADVREAKRRVRTNTPTPPLWETEIKNTFFNNLSDRSDFIKWLLSTSDFIFFNYCLRVLCFFTSKLTQTSYFFGSPIVKMYQPITSHPLVLPNKRSYDKNVTRIYQICTFSNQLV